MNQEDKEDLEVIQFLCYLIRKHTGKTPVWPEDAGSYAEVRHLFGKEARKIPGNILIPKQMWIHFAKARKSLKKSEFDIIGYLRKCNFCGNESKFMPSCKKCNQVYYCDQICQKADWKRGHKLSCK